MNTYAYDASLPCKNPNCKSYGHPHPNCRCYSGGGAENYAKGGHVHFCSSGANHLDGCKYFADGGPMPPAVYADGGEVADKPEHPSLTLGHAAAHHGLLGLYKNVGASKVGEPEKHKKILEDARHHWHRLQSQEDTEMPVQNSQGVKLANHLASGNHEGAAEVMQDHPIGADVGKKRLQSMMGPLSGAMMHLEPHPEGMRSAIDYYRSAMSGKDAVRMKAKDVLGKSKIKIEPDVKAREALKEHLNALEANPEQMLETSGNLGHYAPEQATQLAAGLATSLDYFKSIKPQPIQGGPLDKSIPPDKMAEAGYNRQIDIAEKPLLALQHAERGTLIPQDVTTLQTVYPGLYQSMVSEVGEALIDAKTKGETVPYKKRLGLSMLMGEPLDTTMTPAIMQFIMKSQGDTQRQLQAKGNAKKATAAELKQINKVDEMYETPLERRQMDKKG